MLHNNDYIQHFMSRLNFPARAVSCFTDIENMLDSDSEFGDAHDSVVNRFMYPNAHNINERLAECTELARSRGINIYSMHMVFLINCTPILKQRYAETGVSEEIFWASMDDFRCKLLECMNCEGVPGSFVASWYDGFFMMNRFALGRFQYEHSTYGGEDFTTACGITIKNGDRLIGFHIPSSGVSLTKEVRMDSYKRAYEFYKDEFNGGPVIFGCGSWLLYPRHKEFLPKDSNILGFASDFEIIRSSEREDFGNGWRIFGKDSDLPFDKLPRDTSLKRAYADWLMQGNPAGDGYGVIVFDGEKILR